MTTGPLNPVILYVEDDENDAFLMDYGFRKAAVPCELRVLVDGKEAIGYLAGQGAYAERTSYPLPALVLMDLNLPIVNGLEVLRWIRGSAGISQLPVVIFSSSEHPEDRRKAFALGVSDYWGKPATPEQFVLLAKRVQESYLAQQTQ